MRKKITESNYKEIINLINTEFCKNRMLITEKSVDLDDELSGKSSGIVTKMKDYGHGSIYSDDSFCRIEEHPYHKAKYKGGEENLSKLYDMTGEIMLLSFSLGRFHSLKLGDVVKINSLLNTITIISKDFTGRTEFEIKRNRNGMIEDIDLENDLRDKEIKYNFELKTELPEEDLLLYDSRMCEFNVATA